MCGVEELVEGLGGRWGGHFDVCVGVGVSGGVEVGGGGHGECALEEREGAWEVPCVEGGFVEEARAAC